MKNRTVVKLLSFTAAAALAAVGFAVKSRNDLKEYRLEIENGYARSLDELNAGVSNISIILEKAQFATKPAQLTSMAAQLLSEAEVAKTALSQLPAPDGELTKLNRFLSQVGNYAFTVSKSVITGSESDSKFDVNITALKNTAKKVSEAIESTSITYNNLDYWAKELDGKLDSAVNEESLANALSGLEEDLNDYPTLIYDGPFSDHILEKEPVMLKGAEEIDENAAIKTAALIADCEENELEPDGDQNGKIPAYRFKGASVTAAVSKAGDYGVYMRKTRTVEENVLKYNKMLGKAQKYLENIGITGMKDTYYFTDEGVCVINFAFVDGNTLCYTDLVKVGVATDNGEIMLFEASGYITNHTDRAFPTPEVTKEQAQEVVSKKLTVKESALTLIPTDGAGEVRCYEFLCEASDGQEVLVYVNAVNMNEEKILILLKSDGGTLTK